ncbi:hypothetical protein AAH979_30010 [Plantactinospora sp. ZYX-F-223]|uniref:hypothetical protein n=1 Tax=Plantactinospora sp. ZYX-F-223 TaxID=3144103 RepID=UPI0031FD6868
MKDSTSFEDRLLAVLETEIARRSAAPGAVERRRGIRPTRVGALIGAGTLAAGAAIGMPVVLGQDAGSAAWAVETHADGSVEVKIWELKDPAGLERKLAEAGVPAYISFAPAGTVCAQQTIRTDFSMSEKGLETNGYGFIVHPGRLDPDERLALTAYAMDSSDEVAATQVNIVPLDEERCTIVPLGVPGESTGPTPTPGR